MGVTLKLTENVLNTYMQWNPQVLHDLHESVPYLYDNTVGDGPYNAWIDPILADEWQMIGWNNVSEMTKFGMPGVFTHGNFDTWSPGYLMFIAALHNGISRLYETFGNGGADTVERDAAAGRVRAHLVQAESAAAEDDLVAAQQQQLRADRTAHLAPLLRRQRQAVPAQLLPEEQALDPEGEDRRARGVRARRRRSASRRAGRAAARAAEAGRRDLARDGGVHRHGAGQRRPRAAADDDDDASGSGGPGGSGGPSGAGRAGRSAKAQDRTRRQPTSAHLPRRLLHRPHGSAVQPHRRLAARLSVLEPERSAEDAVRRHRLDVPRAVQRAGGPRRRRQGARRARWRR